MSNEYKRNESQTNKLEIDQNIKHVNERNRTRCIKNCNIIYKNLKINPTTHRKEHINCVPRSVESV